jgi:hypothetical protein
LTEQEKPPKILNVIFQGLIVFFQDTSDEDPKKHKITALMPNVGADHSYRAGNWLAEVSLAAESYKLTGVKAGDKLFNPREHTMLPKVSLRQVVSRHEVFARIELDLPEQLWSFRTVTLDEDVFVDPRFLQQHGLKEMLVANTHIFTYHVKDGSELHDVRLGEHPWAPDADYDATVANLHVIAGPECRPRVAHNIDEFHTATALMNDVELRLKENTGLLPPIPSQTTINERVQGVSQAELEDLTSRYIRLTEMGRIIRRRKIGPDQRPTPQDIGGVWEVIDELSESLSCGTSGGRQP